MSSIRRSRADRCPPHGVPRPRRVAESALVAALVAAGGMATVIAGCDTFAPPRTGEPTAITAPGTPTAPATAAPGMVFNVGGQLVTPVAVVRTTVEAVSDVTGKPADRVNLVNCMGSPCPSEGALNAPIALVMFVDYACDHCREFVLETLPVIRERFVDTGKARLYAHPITGLGRPAIMTTAALCAAEQGKYFEFQRLAFESNMVGPAGDVMDTIQVASQQLGIDWPRLEACMAAPGSQGRAIAISEEAVRLGIRNTPALLVGDTLLEGALDEGTFIRRIDRALALPAAAP